MKVTLLFTAVSIFHLCSQIIPAYAEAPLDSWRNNVKVRPVTPNLKAHSIHTYFGISPESPDGKYVLFYSSKEAEGHKGEIGIIERETGKIEVLVKGLTVEDAHRAACQQWVCGGEQVVFHDVRDGRWTVLAVDIETRTQRVIASGRQLGWSTPDAEVVPVYGPHFAPGEHRDLELVHVETGKITTLLTAEKVKEHYPEWVAEKFKDRKLNIFFPNLSPDGKKVFFKMCSPKKVGADQGDPIVFRAKGSDRYGIFVYDLKTKTCLYQHNKWGHPAWHPDSSRIVTMWSNGVTMIGLESGKGAGHKELPSFGNGHPAMSPDGKLFATDSTMAAFGGSIRDWVVAVGDLKAGEYTVIHKFGGSEGAKSWRKSHPHPAFSSDGKRIYFNVNEGEWTQLFVAEIE